MPFLSLSQKKLQKILNICNQISPKKSDVEIFTFLKIGLSDNKVSFDAVNQNLSFCASLEPANLEFSGDNLEFLIKTDVLSGTVGLIKDENVGLDIDIALGGDIDIDINIKKTSFYGGTTDVNICFFIVKKPVGLILNVF